MKSISIYGVIMAGGSGERFWPRSRTKRPKQYLSIVSESTMIQDTVARLEMLIPQEQILIVTNQTQLHFVREQLPHLPEENILLEPIGRDTACCIAYAAQFVKKKDADAVMVVLPADHVIKDRQAFRDDLQRAAEFVRKKRTLLTLGIEPTYPSTGYGYIQKGSPVSQESDERIFAVKAFYEKPDSMTATEYVSDGSYLWNSGIFVWRADTILEEIEQYLPQLHASSEKMARADAESLRTIFCELPKISIDYGVMEKSQRVVVMDVAFDWDDVGSWSSLCNHYPHDDCGNVTLGNSVTYDSKRCIVCCDGESLIATLGVEDLVIVKDGDAFLVCKRDRAQDIKLLLKELGKDKKEFL